MKFGALSARHALGTAIISVLLPLAASASWANEGVRDCWKTPGPGCVDLAQPTPRKDAGPATASQQATPPAPGQTALPQPKI